MHPHSTTLCLVGIVLLAGCAGVQFQWGSDPSTATTTPTPDTKEDITQYPPGISASGVPNPSTLSSAHATLLEGQSYSVSKSYEIEYANGTVYTHEAVSTQVAANNERYLYNATVRGTTDRIYGSSNATLVRYSNGSVVVQKIEIGGETSYRIVTGSNGEPVSPSGLLPDPTASDRISILFGALSNVSVTHQGGSVYLVEASSLKQDSLPVNGILITNVTDFNFAATVTSDGLVRQYTVSYEGEINGQKVSVREQRAYDSVGQTTVEEPSWYEHAVSNSLRTRIYKIHNCRSATVSSY